MGDVSNPTADGRVTIPRDVLDALGLKPGAAIEIEREGDRIVLRRGTTPTDDASRSDEDDWEARFAEARRHAIPLTDMTVDEYMAMIREPVPLPDGT